MGKFHGKGTYRYATGSVYTGEFHDGKRHGRGTLKTADGETYDVTYENDKLL